MTIGFPQPRVRALLVASVLILSGLGGCSSGGRANTDGGASGVNGGNGRTGSGGATANVGSGE